MRYIAFATEHPNAPRLVAALGNIAGLAFGFVEQNIGNLETALICLHYSGVLHRDNPRDLLFGAAVHYAARAVAQYSNHMLARAAERTVKEIYS